MYLTHTSIDLSLYLVYHTHTIVQTSHSNVYIPHSQALAGEVGMSAELDEVAKSLYNGQLPSIWRALAPATLKGLGNWIIHFHKRNQQYLQWVRSCCERHYDDTLYTLTG